MPHLRSCIHNSLCLRRIHCVCRLILRSDRWHSAYCRELARMPCTSLLWPLWREYVQHTQTLAWCSTTRAIPGIQSWHVACRSRTNAIVSKRCARGVCVRCVPTAFSQRVSYSLEVYQDIEYTRVVIWLIPAPTCIALPLVHADELCPLQNAEFFVPAPRSARP